MPSPVVPTKRRRSRSTSSGRTPTPGSTSSEHIVEAVASGELDLGFVGTRALSDLGAPSFDALTAPMLVDSYPLQQAIMDSDIPDRLLVSLDDVGVTGLDVAAGPLRRPLGVSGPFLNPGDFAGTTFHTVRSASNAATVAALGATHTDVFGAERDDGLVDGTIDGTENSIDWMLEQRSRALCDAQRRAVAGDRRPDRQPGRLCRALRRRSADASRFGRRVAGFGDRTG